MNSLLLYLWIGCHVLPPLIKRTKSLRVDKGEVGTAETQGKEKRGPHDFELIEFIDGRVSVGRVRALGLGLLLWGDRHGPDGLGPAGLVVARVLLFGLGPRQRAVLGPVVKYLIRITIFTKCFGNSQLAAKAI